MTVPRSPLVRGPLRAAAPLLVCARLVVDDDDTAWGAVDAVPPAHDAILPEHEAEALLHQIRSGLGTLLFVEPANRGQAGLKALALVRGADESLGEPGGAEDGLHLLKLRGGAIALPPEIVADRLV